MNASWNTPVVVLCFLLFLALPAVAQNSPPPPRIDLYPVGIDIAFCERRGYFDFGNNREQEIDKSNLFITGAFFGKHFSIVRWLRLQTAISLGFGSALEDTLSGIQLDDGTVQTLELRSKFFHAGLIPELQFPMPVQPDLVLFVRIGGGGHYLKLREEETIAGNQGVRIADPYSEEHSAFSLSGHAGFGLEILVRNGFGFSLAYALRYWNPVRYTTTRDLFPIAAINYHERFLSHVFMFVLLLERTP